MDYSQRKINLDVLIAKIESGNTSLYTSLYKKSNGTQQYLYAESFHCSLYKNSLPYSHATTMMKCVCSEEKDLQRKLGYMEFCSVNRGCRAESVRQELQIVDATE